VREFCPDTLQIYQKDGRGKNASGKVRNQK